MTKSLLAGAAALALVAGAAVAQDATVSRTTTTQTVPAVGDATVTKVQKSYDPYTGTTTQRVETTREAAPGSVTTTTTSVPTPLYGDPGHVTTYQERTVTPAPVTTQKSYTTETTTPVQSTTSYSRTTTTTER